MPVISRFYGIIIRMSYTCYIWRKHGCHKYKQWRSFGRRASTKSSGDGVRMGKFSFR